MPGGVHNQGRIVDIGGGNRRTEGLARQTYDQNTPLRIHRNLVKKRKEQGDKDGGDEDGEEEKNKRENTE